MGAMMYTGVAPFTYSGRNVNLKFRFAFFSVLLSFCNGASRFWGLKSHQRLLWHVPVRHVASRSLSSRSWPRLRKSSGVKSEFSDFTTKKSDSLVVAKNRINHVLKSVSPTFLVGTAATGGIVHFIRSNGEATRRAFYFWSRAGPMVIHYRFTQWWLEASHADRLKRDQVYNTLHNRYCHPCLDIILHLKGLYVKIGQVLSARPDFMPRQYVELFATVQDAIPQWPMEQVEEIVRRELQVEYGLSLNDVFESMDPVALGSASIGQVHRAVLKSPWDKKDPNYKGGHVVAVKVMHPNARDRFLHDFQVFKWLCRIALPGWKPILVELERQIMTEFDYRNEAASLEQVRTNMSRTQYARKICIPQPLIGLCSTHLLVMEMLEGKKLSDAIEDQLTAALGGDRKIVHDFMRRKRDALMLEADMQEPATETAAHLVEIVIESEDRSSVSKFFRTMSIALQLNALYRKARHYVDLLIDVHGHQIFLDGCFNGDPHPVSFYTGCVLFFLHKRSNDSFHPGQRTRAFQRQTWAD